MNEIPTIVYAAGILTLWVSGNLLLVFLKRKFFPNKEHNPNLQTLNNKLDDQMKVLIAIKTILEGMRK